MLSCADLLGLDSRLCRALPSMLRCECKVQPTGLGHMAFKDEGRAGAVMTGAGGTWSTCKTISILTLSLCADTANRKAATLRIRGGLALQGLFDPGNAPYETRLATGSAPVQGRLVINEHTQNVCVCDRDRTCKQHRQ